MTSDHSVVAVLRRALVDRTHLAERVQEFQAAVWSAQRVQLGVSSEAEEILRTLAHDLDKLVVDPTSRAEDPSYYGTQAAVAEIEGALEALRRVGAA